MKCNEIEKRLDAWVDRELSLAEAREVERHLKNCSACSREARILVRLARALDGFEPVQAPRNFSLKVRQAARALSDPPDLAQWWRNLTLAWRGAVCGAALAGLVCGGVMGTSMATTLDTDMPSSPYQIVADSGSLYP